MDPVSLLTEHFQSLKISDPHPNSNPCVISTESLNIPRSVDNEFEWDFNSPKPPAITYGTVEKKSLWKLRRGKTNSSVSTNHSHKPNKDTESQESYYESTLEYESVDQYTKRNVLVWIFALLVVALASLITLNGYLAYPYLDIHTVHSVVEIFESG